MNYVTDDYINNYLRTVQPHYDGVLGEIEKESRDADVPIIPHETARLLSVLLTLKKPRNILEVGTAVGFSAGLMTRYLEEGGKFARKCQSKGSRFAERYGRVPTEDFQ